MRTIRSLRLRREPLAALDRADLSRVVGGLTLGDACGPSGNRVCDLTEEAGGCHWKETFGPDCLTLSPCH